MKTRFESLFWSFLSRTFREELEDQMRGEMGLRIRKELVAELKASISEELRAELAPEVVNSLRTQMMPAVRADIVRAVRAELTAELTPQIQTKLKNELKPAITEGLRAELRPAVREEVQRTLGMELKPRVEAELKDELRTYIFTTEADGLRAEIIQQVREREEPIVRLQMRKEIEDSNYAREVIKDLRYEYIINEVPKVRRELREELEPSIRAEMKPRVEENLEAELREDLRFRLMPKLRSDLQLDFVLNERPQLLRKLRSHAEEDFTRNEKPLIRAAVRRALSDARKTIFTEDDVGEFLSVRHYAHLLKRRDEDLLPDRLTMHNVLRRLKSDFDSTVFRTADFDNFYAVSLDSGRRGRWSRPFHLLELRTLIDQRILHSPFRVLPVYLGVGGRQTAPEEFIRNSEADLFRWIWTDGTVKQKLRPRVKALLSLCSEELLAKFHVNHVPSYEIADLVEPIASIKQLKAQGNWISPWYER